MNNNNNNNNNNNIVRGYVLRYCAHEFGVNKICGRWFIRISIRTNSIDEPLKPLTLSFVTTLDERFKYNIELTQCTICGFCYISYSEKNPKILNNLTFDEDEIPMLYVDSSTTELFFYYLRYQEQVDALTREWAKVLIISRVKDELEILLAQTDWPNVIQRPAVRKDYEIISGQGGQLLKNKIINGVCSKNGCNRVTTIWELPFNNDDDMGFKTYNCENCEHNYIVSSSEEKDPELLSLNDLNVNAEYIYGNLYYYDNRLFYYQYIIGEVNGDFIKQEYFKEIGIFIKENGSVSVWTTLHKRTLTYDFLTDPFP